MIFTTPPFIKICYIHKHISLRAQIAKALWSFNKLLEQQVLICIRQKLNDCIVY